MSHQANTHSIWRFRIFTPKEGKKPSTKTRIELPEGATIFHCQPSLSTGGFNLYATVRKDAKMEKRNFIICRTGADLPDGIEDCQPVASFGLVHIFEVPSHVSIQFATADTKLEG